MKCRSAEVKENVTNMPSVKAIAPDPPHSAATTSKGLPYMSRNYIESMIADGCKIILVDDYVLKVDAWVKYHPGGEISILHLVGRDATDEVKACVLSTKYISCRILINKSC